MSMLWIWALIGALIGLLGYIASMEQSPAKTETIVEWRDLDDFDSQDQLEELEEEE